MEAVGWAKARLRAVPTRVSSGTTTWARFAVPTLRARRVRHELGPNFGGVLAERGNGAVAAWRAVVARGRRGVAHRPRGRGDVDAAQLRMHREIGGGVDAGKGDVVFRKFLRQRRLVGGAEHRGDARVGLAAALDALDVGGKRE